VQLTGKPHPAGPVSKPAQKQKLAIFFCSDVGRKQ
jgi:hypothetical protein